MNGKEAVKAVMHGDEGSLQDGRVKTILKIIDILKEACFDVKIHEILFHGNEGSSPSSKIYRKKVRILNIPRQNMHRYFYRFGQNHNT